jgi:hypothetical protein
VTDQEDRRVGQPDTGERRREMDEYEEFALRRDKILLGLGVFIVVSMGAAAVLGSVKNTEIALAVLTIGGGLLGAPSFLRWDELRGKRR